MTDIKFDQSRGAFGRSRSVRIESAGWRSDKQQTLMFADETVAMIMTSYDAEIPLAQQFEFT